MKSRSGSSIASNSSCHSNRHAGPPNPVSDLLSIAADVAECQLRWVALRCISKPACDSAAPRSLAAAAGGFYNRTVAAETTLESQERREIYLDRRVVTVTPDRIDVHPARSIVFLPLLTLLLGLSAFPVIYFWGGSMSVELRLLITLASVLIVPLSGIGLVYSIAGAHIVVERAKQSIVLQQGYLGMGVGTQDLVPFWKIDRVTVRELTPHDYRGHHEDFAQYEIIVKKLSGKELSVGLVTVARAEATEGLSRAREVASLIAEMAGSKVHVARPRRGPMRPEGA
jgi:hypothetical protein